MREKIFFLLEKALRTAGNNARPEEYASKSAVRACLAGIFAWLALGLVFGEMFFSFIAGIIFAGIVFALLLYAPVGKARRDSAEIEGEMPLALMSIAAELNMNIPLEKCIENYAKAGSSILSKNLWQVIRESREMGKPLQESLFSLAERSGSLEVKRCIAQLSAALEQGKEGRRGDGVKRIAAEMLSRQKAQSREFSGKLAVFSLLFIAVSSIVPALFQSFIIVGSMVLAMDLSPSQALAATVIVFPAIDIIVLAFIRSKTPVFLRD